jgi:hypothetical protein
VEVAAATERHSMRIEIQARLWSVVTVRVSPPQLNMDRPAATMPRAQKASITATAGYAADDLEFDTAMFQLAVGFRHDALVLDRGDGNHRFARRCRRIANSFRAIFARGSLEAILCLI